MATAERTMMGTYELVRRLGTGGMGEVWLARQRGAAGFARDVAIKRLLPHAMEQPDVVQMFIEEAQITGRLRHPNVVNVVELGAAESGELYLVLEYCDGTGLNKILRDSENRLSPSAALTVARDIALALYAAHTLTDDDGKDLGLVHRDVTPSNVMIDRWGHVKLMDFGIAKVKAKSNQTEAGIIKGKIAYLAPEQLQSEVDPRSDLFALGLVGWEIVAGRQARSATSDAAMVAKVATEAIAPIQSVVKDLPDGVAAVIDKACAIKPEDRYQNGQEMAQALLDALTQLNTGGVETARNELSKLVETAVKRESASGGANTLSSRTADGEHPIALTLHSLVMQADGHTLSRPLSADMIKAIAPPDARRTGITKTGTAIRRRRSLALPVAAGVLSMLVFGGALFVRMRQHHNPAPAVVAHADPPTPPPVAVDPHPAPPPVVPEAVHDAGAPQTTVAAIAPTPHTTSNPHEHAAHHVVAAATHVADNRPGRLGIFVRGGGEMTIRGPSGTFHAEDAWRSGEILPGRYTIHVSNHSLQVERDVTVTVAPGDDNRQVIDLEHQG